MQKEPSKSTKDRPDDIITPSSVSWRRKKLLIIIILSFILLFTAVSLFLVFENNKTKTKTEPKNDLKKSISTLENKYMGSKITLKINDNQGWNITSSNDPSNTIYKNSSGDCSISIGQNMNVKSDINSGRTLNSQIDEVFKAISKSLNSNNLAVGDTTTKEIESSKGKIEFVSKEASYTGNNGQAKTIGVYGQWIGDYEFIITAECPTENWNSNKSNIENFIDSINLGIT